MTKSYLKSMIVLIGIVLSSGNLAYAQWKLETIEDDFTDDVIKVGYLEQGASQIAVKCQGGVYELVYVTSDRTVDMFTLAVIEQAGSAKLMFRTDKDIPAAVTAKLDLLVDGRLRVAGKLSPANVKSIGEMKQGIAVQLSIADTFSNQMKFSGKGSSSVIKQINAECNALPYKMTLDETAKLSWILVSILFPPLP